MKPKSCAEAEPNPDRPTKLASNTTLSVVFIECFPPEGSPPVGGSVLDRILLAQGRNGRKKALRQGAARCDWMA
jgi:hypothetical protein